MARSKPSESPKPRMPSGLAEYRDSLWELKYTMKLLLRLKDLPEWGMDSELAEVERLLKVVAEAEELAAKARDNVRKEAYSIFQKARKLWTVKELQEATGYTEP